MRRIFLRRPVQRFGYGTGNTAGVAGGFRPTGRPVRPRPEQGGGLQVLEQGSRLPWLCLQPNRTGRAGTALLDGVAMTRTGAAAGQEKVSRYGLTSGKALFLSPLPASEGPT